MTCQWMACSAVATHRAIYMPDSTILRKVQAVCAKHSAMLTKEYTVEKLTHR